MLGARREEVFALQVDVRKKVLWGQWAECALIGARNWRGRETLPQTMTTTRGQLLLLPTASNNILDSGRLVRGVGAWGVGHARSQCVTARRVPVTGATSPRTELFLVPQSASITAPPSSAAQRAQAQTQRKRLRENDDSTHEEWPNSSE